MADDRVQEFLASAEAEAVAGVSAPDRAVIAKRLHAALDEVGTPLEKLGASDAHGWLLHCVPDEFPPSDPLGRHVVPVLRALLDFSERRAGRKLGSLRSACEPLLPELEDALVHGHAHHHHPHDDEDAPATPYVRESPKVGRNDPCPCGSGRKYKKCHGS